MRKFDTHDLKPMAMEDAVKVQAGITADTVTVERQDGKQVVIATATLAQHLERGFKLVEEKKKLADIFKPEKPTKKKAEPAE